MYEVASLDRTPKMACCDHNNSIQVYELSLNAGGDPTPKRLVYPQRLQQTLHDKVEGSLLLVRL